MRALVVDDSRAIRSFMKRMLLPLKFDVVDAGNGREGLDRVEDSGPFELALVDWNMPEMNGLEFVQAVRARPDLAGMKIVMVTSETDTSYMEAALSSGANEYIMKPFTDEALREKLTIVGLEVE